MHESGLTRSRSWCILAGPSAEQRCSASLSLCSATRSTTACGSAARRAQAALICQEAPCPVMLGMCFLLVFGGEQPSADSRRRLMVCAWRTERHTRSSALDGCPTTAAAALAPHVLTRRGAISVDMCHLCRRTISAHECHLCTRVSSLCKRVICIYTLSLYKRTEWVRARARG